jgi:O-antigen ligase
MLVSSGVLILAILFTFQEDILIKLEKNRQDSSGDLAEHVESISNVASDASNLERINRWNCALRMFEERPVFGWGPGTYKFQYAPFQSSQELTIISTNFGDLGNAHSEYLGPLAEMGVLGLLTFLAIIILFYVKSIQLYYKLQNKELKVLVMSSIAGFTTYVTHGILNNFLDTDKASLPFWGFMAVIVAIDVYYKNKPAEIEG